MVYGGVDTETIDLSEESVWSGEPHDYAHTGSVRHLPELRRLIFAGEYEQAARFGEAHSLGHPRSQAAYQSLGTLTLRFPDHTEIRDYSRELRMDDAIATVHYRMGDAVFTRQTIASYPHQVVAIELSCSENRRITCEITLDSLHQKSRVVPDKGGISLVGTSDAIQFQAIVNVRTEGGMVRVSDGTLQIREADSAVVFLAAATNFVGYADLSGDPATRCRAVLSKVEPLDFQSILQTHTKDFRRLYQRVSIDLGGTTEEDLPTDELIRQVSAGNRSALLEEKLFNFGRYLTISGARPGTQPLNLVGVWAVDGLEAPWGGKWTLNINAELNTWPVETTNLAECHEPLLALLDDLKETGTRVAREHYGCRGFVAHHNTDLWRGAAPVDTPFHGLWAMGSAWLCRHIVEHYDFSRDVGFLASAYPTLREAALFYEDFLTEGPDGFLVSCPAISWEQSFLLPDGEEGRLTYGPTMDNEILHDFFSNCLRAAATLNTDEADQRRWRSILRRLRPIEIDPETGRLMEWAYPAEKAHASGQMTPLWAVAPGNQISPQDTPGLAHAAVNYLKHHIPQIPEWESAGSWVSGTILNYWARLCEETNAYATLVKAMREKLHPNLMMHFYPEEYFQIDGNMGATAGIAEMLLQSHRTTKDGHPILDVLPALPGEWPTGSVRGLRARGAFEVDIFWTDGKLEWIDLTSLTGTSFLATYKGQTFDGDIVRPKSLRITQEDFIKNSATGARPE